MDSSAFWQRVETELAQHDLLKHPFYQAWSAGELTRDDLIFYAEQYYRHVSSFPAYLTSLHARLPEGAMRRAVLANAYEEECDGVSHAELWRRFAEGMSENRQECDFSAEPNAEMAGLVAKFRALAGEAPVAAAFGAFYAYESQVPRIAAEKLAGLTKHYGADERACSYFSLHQTADVHHSNVWRKIIGGLIENDPQRAAEALDGISTAAGALWAALDGIERDRPGRGKRCCAAQTN